MLMGVRGLIVLNACFESSYINGEQAVIIPVDGSITLPYCLFFIIGKVLRVAD